MKTIDQCTAGGLYRYKERPAAKRFEVKVRGQSTFNRLAIHYLGSKDPFQSPNYVEVRGTLRRVAVASNLRFMEGNAKELNRHNNNLLAVIVHECDEAAHK